MSEVFRRFTPELEIRGAGQGGDGRTIVGIAVPYGRAQVIDESLTEQFARGAFNRQLAAANRVRFARGHLASGGGVIGRTLELRDDPAGLIGVFRVSATPLGEETLELVRDGALTDLSIGFRPRQNRRLSDGTVERVTADLREVAVVCEGAYGAAASVTAVRSVEREQVEREQVEREQVERSRRVLAEVLARAPRLPPVE
ncbi:MULTISPECIES: HK97 family phage prohead protease [unclassified Pseudonocardia]|uniref:HK97 family phage prohead protease n=1 Tax=unclassified Pseudonocardia TaxID=2619320 RepID=UPI00094AAA26|nr:MULTISPECIES: HK97 family phage prohead protease [unclassified Pseudonocardia]